MKKFLLAFIILLWAFSCGKKTGANSQIMDESEKKVFISSAFASMVVDLMCPRSLPGGKDWIDKNMIFNKTTPINLIAGFACMITIQQYTTASGAVVTPVAKPATIFLDQTGTGSSSLTLYHDTENSFQKSLLATATAYEISIFENSNYPVQGTNGIIYSANSDLSHISTPVLKTKYVSFHFSATSGNITSLSLDVSRLNSKIGMNSKDWKVSSISNCLSFSNNCSIVLSYTPKSNYEYLTAPLFIHFMNNSGIVQSTNISLKFRGGSDQKINES